MADEEAFGYPNINLYFHQTNGNEIQLTDSCVPQNLKVNPIVLQTNTPPWFDENSHLTSFDQQTLFCAPIQPQTQTMQEEQLQKAQNILFPNLSSLLHSLPPSPSKSQSNVQQTSSANAASKSSSSSNSLYPNLLNLQDNLGTDTVKTLRWMKLTSAQFHSLKDNEGRISDPNKHIIKQKIFKGVTLFP